MIPNLISGIFMGMTVDIYSLYFAPVGMITGFVSGWIFRKMSVKKAWILPAAAVITVPGTIVSALINAALFGGVTSSGSSLLVQLLARTPLGLTGSIFAVQFFTDYLDRCISVFLVSICTVSLGSEIRQKLSGRIGREMERYSRITDKNRREIVLLRAFPCAWGKCTFCDYIEDNGKR